MVVADITEPVAAIIVGLLTLVGVIVNTLVLSKTHEKTKQINSAVNDCKPSEPRLYDLVRQNHDDIVQVGKQVDELIVWKLTFDPEQNDDSSQ